MVLVDCWIWVVAVGSETRLIARIYSEMCYKSQPSALAYMTERMIGAAKLDTTIYEDVEAENPIHNRLWQ